MIDETKSVEKGNGQDPIIVFKRGIPDCRLPIRADRAALGTLPIAAYRHCEAVCAASGYGWYVFSPLNFTVVWDGSDMLWTYEGADSWFPLSSAQAPGFSEFFDKFAPDFAKGFAPPFLTNTPHPGVLQIWTGLFVRTAAGWSTAIRSLVNLPASRSYELFEGIVDTDQWFGPLFTNLRIIKVDQPVVFQTEIPLFQVQPIPRLAFSADTQNRFECVDEPMSLSDADWDAFKTTIVDSAGDSQRPIGHYAAGSRRRQRT